MSLEGWKAFFEIGGVVLLLLTFAFGAGALIVNNRLNAIQAKELGDFKIKFEEEQQKTALAQKEAAEAKQIASGFERDISTANQRAAEANAKAEGFRLDIAKANERAAEAERIAEEEGLARIKIEERLASRRIGQKQHAELVAALRPYRGAVVEVTKLGDFEAGQFADDILSVLAEAEWNVRLTVIGVYAPPRYGLTCVINDSTPAGKALVAAMRSLPTAAVEAAPNLPVNARVLVGLKPPA